MLDRNDIKLIHEKSKYNKLNTFKDFMSDNIFEKNETSVPFVISQRLQNLLTDIEHPIAERLVADSFSMETYTTVATLIDLDDGNIDRFTYTIPNKFTDFITSDEMSHINIEKESLPTSKGRIYDIMKNNKELYERYRTSIKIGRLVNKLYPNEYKPNGDGSIEELVDAIKLSRTRKFDRFDIVEGEDIVKYYDEGSYDEEASNGSELGNSCMSAKKCGEYIKFYAENKGVKLVILRSNKGDKILGRALLWDISHVNGKERDGKFMDRVYFTHNHQKELFLEHAKNNGWFHRYAQHNSASGKMWNPDTEEYDYLIFKTKSTFKKSSNDKYPYMDTMKWLYVNKGYLANSVQYKEKDDEVFFMEDVNGEYHIEGKGRYVEHYNDYIDDKDLTYCRLGDDYRLSDDAWWIESEHAYATDEYYNNHYTVGNDGNVILIDDAVEFIDTWGNKQMVAEEFAQNNYYFCDREEAWYEEAASSEYYDTFIPYEKCIDYLNDDTIIDDVIKGKDVETDVMEIGDGNYFKYYPRDKKGYEIDINEYNESQIGVTDGAIIFMNELQDKFDLVTTDIEDETKEWFHKVRDKDLYQKDYRGELVSNLELTDNDLI